MENLEERIKRAHRIATKQGKKTYEDPITGFEVYTLEYLVNRGYCCNQGCRHCPYSDPEISSININAAKDNLKS